MGISPRASLDITLGSKYAHCIKMYNVRIAAYVLFGCNFVTLEHISATLPRLLEHRVRLKQSQTVSAISLESNDEIYRVFGNVLNATYL
jgi:hypothetical protein